MADGQALFLSKAFSWAPGIESSQDWMAWTKRKKQIENTSQAPALAFTSPLFRRRLSQLSKMTVQVVHDLVEAIPEAKDCPQVFASFRGELAREGDINTQLIQDKEILPASFSLSVFNTPIALASIALHLTKGYSVVFPAKQNFSAAFSAACAPLLCGDEEHILFTYADEQVGDCYEKLEAPYQTVKQEDGYKALSFAVLIGTKEDKNCFIQLDREHTSTPQQLLAYLLTQSA